MSNATSAAFPMAFGQNDDGATGMNLREYMLIHYVAAMITARGSTTGDPEIMVDNAMHFVDLTLTALREKR